MAAPRAKLDAELVEETLERLRRDVQPICEKFTLRYDHLGASYDKSLYGFNREKGKIIRLRLINLRTGKLRSYNALLYTMIHEICHCRYHSHGSRFYALLRKANAYANKLGLYDPERNQMPQRPIHPPYFDPELKQRPARTVGDPVQLELFA